jgi:dimethylargininase
MMIFTHAIVRPPPPGYAGGLTSASEGPPDLDLALAQHGAYCEALATCGLEVIGLPADDRHPDSCFVEDTAIVTARGAVLTRPGAPSRQGEVAAIEPALRERVQDLARIEAPGTVDGGDVCDADGRFLVGISARTNEHGATQLARILEGWGFRTGLVDLRGQPGLLHLKSGLSYLGDGRMVISRELAGCPALDAYDTIEATPAEAYAANCVAINGRVLVAAGYPRLAATLAARGCEVLPLDMSEFRKMDGGLSCLSLRF